MKSFIALILFGYCSLFAASTSQAQGSAVSPRSSHGDLLGDPASRAQASAGKKRLDPMVVDDLTFLRRVSLDLTGRLPEPATIEDFLSSTAADKRSDFIEAILASEAFEVRWTAFYRDLLKTSKITFTGYFRNKFHAYLKDGVVRDRSWKDMAREILTSGGENEDTDSTVTFPYWAFNAYQNYHRLDFLDDQISFVTETMLGIRTECISCHDGAFHLENVNKGLSRHTRENFWAMAAFLSKSAIYEEAPPEGDNGDFSEYLKRLKYVDMDAPGFEVGAGRLEIDSLYSDGEYTATSGAFESVRPPRDGGVIQPAYLFSGEEPAPGETRREALARMITNDRQFARNMVNRIWAQLFGEGFVSPVNNWDMGRIDKATAASLDTTVQARNVALMESLTDYFIALDYKIKPFIRYLCNTELYQWDYMADERNHQDVVAYWKGKSRIRRLDAETIVDTIHQRLGYERPIFVSGRADTAFYSTWAMPDVSEPSYEAVTSILYEDGFDLQQYGYANQQEYEEVRTALVDLLQRLGRGRSPNERSRDTDMPAVMALLNGSDHKWLGDWEKSPVIASMRDALNDGVSPENVGRSIFRDLFFREPVEAELTFVVEHLQGSNKGSALADLYWALFNHPDFLFK